MFVMNGLVHYNIWTSPLYQLDCWTVKFLSYFQNTGYLKHQIQIKIQVIFQEDFHICNGNSCIASSPIIHILPKYLIYLDTWIGFSSLCPHLCAVNILSSANPFLQNSFSPLWVCLWSVKFPNRENDFWQSEH